MTNNFEQQMDVSDSDSDYDSDEEDLYFNPDEQSNTRFNIVLCELYCKLHGKGNGGKLFYYHLNISRFKKLNINILSEICNNYNTYYRNLVSQESSPFSRIKNFNNIVSKDDYIRPQIAENITLETGHCVCIIKTIWIKLIQRTWKKVFALRKTIIKRRSNINSLKIRELTGKWPENCRVYPQLQGMLRFK
jgi:hypothetical protein